MSAKFEIKNKNVLYLSSIKDCGLKHVYMLNNETMLKFYIIVLQMEFFLKTEFITYQNYDLFSEQNVHNLNKIN